LWLPVENAVMDRERASDGVVWGVVATLAMSTLLLAATAIGLSPAPRPVYEAVVALVLGDLPAAVLLFSGLAAHFVYGGAVGAVVAGVVPRVTPGHGLAVGLGLWLLSGVLVLPALGWGLLGLAIGPALVAGNLLTHLVYGGVFGALVDRDGSTTGTTDW
jgi:hypothetical protein